MHEYYDYDDNDDNYNDDYDYDNNYDPYKFYFKFDVGNSSLSDWLEKTIKDIMNNPVVSGFPVVSLPVNSYFSNTVNGLGSVLYLGNNYQNDQIWKTKYFIKNELEIEYKNHIKSHPAHFVNQPSYYNSMFDILN